ncbi:unnamed protein product [Cunninghamella echinulata]
MSFSTSSWETYLSSQETQVYIRLFKLASQTKPGIVTGTEAVQFFANSGVPNGILSDIWETADRDNVGYLTPETFSIALKLIACAQHGTEVADPIISTVVPLPQFKGIPNDVNVVSPNVTGNSSISSANNITPAEREKYQSIFKAHQPVNGVLNATTAKNIFIKSKLSNDILGQIWALADVRQSGSLNQTEFTIAMHYIAKLMDGTLNVLPNQLPPPVYASAAGPASTPMLANQQSPVLRQFSGSNNNNNNNNNGSNTPIISQQLTGNKMIMTPPQRAATIDSLGNLAFSSSTENIQRTWDVTPTEKSQYDTFFDRIDSQRQGFIQGKEAVEFFKNSRLPDNDLAHIWDLADTSQSGRLSRDEFAVAMHLIHKRLRGETLPPSLPSTLVPPSPRVPIASPSHLHRSATTAAASVNRNVGYDPFNPPAQAAPLIEEDLLGDFGNNDQLTQDTNQVNQLQNQITSLKSATVEVKQQKLTAEQTIEQLAKQKQELQVQMTQVKMAHEAEVKELNELQEIIKREEPEWMQIKNEHEIAQQQLSATQQQIQQLKQQIEKSRAESENYRRQVHEIQEETAALIAQVESLNSQSKQQNMMVDINHRQVKAAEQDREQAKRDLQDAKEVKGITESARGLSINDQSSSTAAANATGTTTHFSTIDNDDSSDDDDSSSSDDDDDHHHESIKQGKNNMEAHSPNFKNSPFHSFATTSSPQPSIENKTTTPFNDQFFDIFSPHLTQAEAQVQQNAETSQSNDFDAVFGDLAGIPSPEEKQDNNLDNNATTTSSSPVTSLSTATKKHRTPPPPPPPSQTTTSTTTNNFDDVFNDFGTSQTKSIDDDFDAAFSGPLSDAKILEGNKNKNNNNSHTLFTHGSKADFDDFDEAFGVFDNENNNNNNNSTPSTSDLPQWDNSFGKNNNHEQEEKKIKLMIGIPFLVVILQQLQQLIMNQQMQIIRQ